MKQLDIPDIRHNSYDFANLFNVYTGSNGNYFFNINRTLYVTGGNDMMPSVYSLYMVQYGDTWTNISYTYYGTIELWWIICKFNDVYNPVSLPVEGTKIKIPTIDVVQSIIDNIKQN
jgi:hypothetical protein